MNDAPAPLLTCRSLEIGFERALLPPVDLAIRAGELWAVVGMNGSGKTTWMRTVLGLEPPVAGTVERAPGLRVAYVPQAASLDPIFPVLVRDVVLMGTLRRERLGGFTGHAARKAVRTALARVGVAGLEKKAFRDLSGGQRQRVLIARALVSQAQLFFLDEPTSALDRQAEETVLQLIDGLRREPGCAVAVVTHHLQVLRSVADHALLLDREPPSAVAGTAAQVLESAGYRRLFGEVAPPRPAEAS